MITKTYTIQGMTCEGCVATVTQKLSGLQDVRKVTVDLAKEEALISSDAPLSIEDLRGAVPNTYTVLEPQGVATSFAKEDGAPSKWKQLRPLFLIFIYLFSAAYLLNMREWELSHFMYDFMGLFYIVFSFFKILDLKGFPGSFRMYDPLAKVVSVYAWVYPFIELALGCMFLFRFQLSAALIATIVILGITTYGVTKTLLDKKSIRCACLGTALNLPMTEATFIENAIMLVMALYMIVQIWM